MLRCQESSHQKSKHQKLAQADHPSKPPQFQYVREWHDEFLNLFPHRGDYLWAEHPTAGARPQWHTESSHPLSDRQIQQGNYLFGVRFGALTHYVMLDIDPTSIYHPSCDPLAIDNLMAALEPLGLVSYVAVQSSTRGGIHLYLPFQEAQKSWAIAHAAAFLLAHQGFGLSPGQLELFPNPKPYSHTPTLYSGHRLPLQSGSYLLNAEWGGIYSTQAEFGKRWKFAQNRNDVSRSEVEAVLNQAQHRAYRNLRTGGQKYLHDLNADIEPGWTGLGQTNFLLGKIANRERVFHHILWGGDPLETADLAEAIARIARSLPGFQEFCQHQADLNQKAIEWARSAIQRYYPYPYGAISSQTQTQDQFTSAETTLSWNQKQAEAARKRITDAIVDLLNRNALPAQATARRHTIRTYGVGNKTLDKNCDLWHPNFIASDYRIPVHPIPNHPDPIKLDLTGSCVSTSDQYHPTSENSGLGQQLEPLAKAEYHPITSNKLEGGVASNVPQEQFEGNPSDQVGGSGGVSTGQLEIQKQPQGIEWVRLALTQIELRKKQNLASEQIDPEQIDPEQIEAKHIGNYEKGEASATNLKSEFVNRQTSTVDCLTTPAATVANTAITLDLEPEQPIAHSITESTLASKFSLSEPEPWRSVNSVTNNYSNPYLHPS